MYYEVKERQSVLDLALQLYGHSDGVRLLMVDNPLLIHSPCAHVLAGDQLLVRAALDADAVQALGGQLVATLDATSPTSLGGDHLPFGQPLATGAPLAVEANCSPAQYNKERCEGIGYWRIGRNFKISPRII